MLGSGEDLPTEAVYEVSEKHSWDVLRTGKYYSWLYTISGIKLQDCVLVSAAEIHEMLFAEWKYESGWLWLFLSFCLPCSEFLGTSVSVLSGSWSRWITSPSSAAGAPRTTTKPGTCTIRYPHSLGGHLWRFFSPAQYCQMGMQLFFTAKHMDFYFFFASLEECALINMGEGIYGQVQEITFYFYENNALHQLDLRGLSA